MSEEAVGKNKNIIQQMDTLKKIFGKIRQIHLEKKKHILTLTKGKINPEDEKTLEQLEGVLTDLKARLKSTEESRSVLNKTYASNVSVLRQEEGKVQALENDLHTLKGKIKSAVDTIDITNNKNTELTEDLRALREEKAKSPTPDADGDSFYSPRGKIAGAAAAAQTKADEAAAQTKADKAAAQTKADEGGAQKGLLRQAYDRVNPMGLFKSAPAVKQSEKPPVLSASPAAPAPAAVVETLEKQPVIELTPAEAPAPAAMKTAIEEAQEKADTAAEVKRQAEEDARVGQEKRQKEADKALETARLKDVETARLEALETARLKDVETAPLVAAGGTTDTNLDLLQLNDAELKDVCEKKSITVGGNVGASGKIRLLLENSDIQVLEYLAQQYNVTETDRTKRIQQLLKLRYTIAAITTWTTKSFNNFSDKYKLELEQKSKTLPEVERVLFIGTQFSILYTSMYS